MAGLLSTTVSVITKKIQKSPTYFLVPIQLEVIRNRFAKHWKPEFKKERREKVIKIELPKENETSEEKIRSFRKRFGLQPKCHYSEKGITLNCTQDIFEAYVPPEGDGKFSIASTSGVKQNVLAVGKKTTSMLSIRKIKGFLDDFHPDDFADQARDIYISAHKAIANHNFEELRDFATERAFCEMTHNIKNKQIRWNFIESLEPARIVRARTNGSDGITYGQLTVRLHTKQSLAIYDRFGRLMHGSEYIGKDVLEYMVFERCLNDEYGKWRIHGKIIPTWQAPKESSARTTIKPEEIKEPEISKPLDKEPSIINPETTSSVSQDQKTL